MKYNVKKLHQINLNCHSKIQINVETQPKLPKVKRRYNKILISFILSSVTDSSFSDTMCSELGNYVCVVNCSFG